MLEEDVIFAAFFFLIFVICNYLYYTSNILFTLAQLFFLVLTVMPLPTKFKSKLNHRIGSTSCTSSYAVFKKHESEFDKKLSPPEQESTPPENLKLSHSESPHYNENGSTSNGQSTPNSSEPDNVDIYWDQDINSFVNAIDKEGKTGGIKRYVTCDHSHSPLDSTIKSQVFNHGEKQAQENIELLGRKLSDLSVQQSCPTYRHKYSPKFNSSLTESFVFSRSPLHISNLTSDSDAESVYCNADSTDDEIKQVKSAVRDNSNHVTSLYDNNIKYWFKRWFMKLQDVKSQGEPEVQINIQQCKFLENRYTPVKVLQLDGSKHNIMNKLPPWKPSASAQFILPVQRNCATAVGMMKKLNQEVD